MFTVLGLGLGFGVQARLSASKSLCSLQDCENVAVTIAVRESVGRILTRQDGRVGMP